jgi:rod shape-determining protein MreC
VTSGIDGIYLPGLPVAKVVSVERNASYARISCAPDAGIDRHAQILVLSSERKVEPPPAEEAPPKDKAGKGKRARPAPVRESKG